MVLLQITSRAGTSDFLALRYELQNRGASQVFAFHTLFHTDRSGERTVDPGLCYLLERQGIVVAGKFLVPVPRGRKVESPEIPYLVALPPGQSVTGQVSLPLPPKTRHPYEPPRPVQAAPGTSATLRIGYIDAAAIRPGTAVIQPTAGGQLVCDYGFGLELQQFADAVFQL